MGSSLRKILEPRNVKEGTCRVPQIQQYRSKISAGKGTARRDPQEGISNDGLRTSSSSTCTSRRTSACPGGPAALRNSILWNMSGMSCGRRNSPPVRSSRWRWTARSANWQPACRAWPTTPTPEARLTARPWIVSLNMNAHPKEEVAE